MASIDNLLPALTPSIIFNFGILIHFLVWKNRNSRIWFLRHIGRYLIRTERRIEAGLGGLDALVRRHQRAFSALIIVCLVFSIIVDPLLGLLLSAGVAISVLEERYFRGGTSEHMLAHVLNNVMAAELTCQEECCK